MLMRRRVSRLIRDAVRPVNCIDLPLVAKALGEPDRPKYLSNSRHVLARSPISGGTQRACARRGTSGEWRKVHRRSMKDELDSRLFKQKAVTRMLEGVGKSIGQFIDERLSSPLLGTFLISWAAWNYKFIVILLSSNSVLRTFELIETVAFPTGLDVALRGFAYPLLTTLLYIYVYPYPAKLVYSTWRRTQYDLTKIRQQYADETLLSIDESRELRAQMQAVKDELAQANTDLQAARADVEGYQRKLVEIERDAAALQNDREKREQALAALTDTRGQLTNRLAATERELSSVREALAVSEAARAKATKDYEEAQKRLDSPPKKQILPDPQRALLMRLATEFGDFVPWGELAKSQPAADQVRTTYLIEDLLARGLLDRSIDEDGEDRGITFTQEGRAAIFEDLSTIRKT